MLQHLGAGHVAEKSWLIPPGGPLNALGVEIDNHVDDPAFLERPRKLLPGDPETRDDDMVTQSVFTPDRLLGSANSEKSGESVDPADARGEMRCKNNGDRCDQHR